MTKRDTAIIKGFAILCIVFHNYYHWMWPSPGENEFDFLATRVTEFFSMLGQQPGDVFKLLFSYLGHYGVQLFLFVSGYGLTVSMLNRPRSWGAFMVSRLKKLYPLLLTAVLTWLLAFVLIHMEWPDSFTWTEIGYKLLFLHTLIPDSGLSINGPWWFFGLIIQLYLLFPLLFRWFRRWGWKAFVGIGVLSYGVVFLFLYGFNGSHTSMVMMNAPGHLPEFCLGMMLACQKDQIIGWGWLAAALLVFCLGNVFQFFYPFTFLAVTVIALFAYQGLKRSSWRKQRISRLLAYFGSISMTLFAVHGFFRVPVLTFAQTMNNYWGHLFTGLVYLLIVWAAAIPAKSFYDFLCRQVDKIGLDNTCDKESGWKDGICQWMRLCVFLLLCMMVVRVFFLLQAHFRIDVEAAQFLGIIKGSVFDFYLVCHALVWLLLPFLLLYRFFPKATFWASFGLVIVYVVVAALLTEYFCRLYMPLDHVILAYSPEEIKDAVTSSASITAAPFLWFLGTMAAVVLLWLLIRKCHPSWVPSLVLLWVALVVAMAVPYKTVIREERHYQDHASFCLAVNQPSYAYIKITDYLKTARTLEESRVTPVAESSSYPFFRKAEDPDVLGPFIERTTDSLPPNFVFIIVESLGQRLTGVESPTVSFTPFIDSLKQEGLYWKHCLSTSERTFGVLPSVFASAPYGKYGFYMIAHPMPNHHSLLRDMKRNGYQTSYYYGAADEFGRFDIFLKANKLDYVYKPGAEMMDSATFGKPDEFQPWGEDDRETLARVKAYKTTHPSSRPNMDVIMTLTTQDPFYFEGVEIYEQRVQEMLMAHPEMSKTEHNNIKNNLNVFASFLYMDDCVRDLMEYYRTLPEFQNTVFFITGDHRMDPLRFNNPLSQFTVPLLVYSPLIPQSRTMNAVVSHLDITPTINAYLHANYDYEINEYCHWLGTSLDTTIAYENKRKQAFMLNNRDVVDYVDGEYMISNNTLYRIDENLLSYPVEDDSVFRRMKSELDEFNTLSRFAVMNDHLMPAAHDRVVLRNDTYDLDLSTSPIFTQHLQEEEGNHYVLMDSAMLYAPLFENLLLTTDKEDLMVDIAFDLQSLDTIRELPLIGVELGSYLMSLQLDSADEVSLNTGRWEHFHQHVSILHEDSKDQKLKIYLFNPNKNRMKYDNIRINVSVVKE